MVRAVFTVEGALVSSRDEGLVGLQDLMVVETGAGSTLFAAARGGGWLTGFDIGQPGQTVEAGFWGIAAQYLQLESTDLLVRQNAPNGPELYMAGLGSAAMHGLRVDDDGAGPLFEAPTVVSAPGYNLGLFTEVEMMDGVDSGFAALRSGGLATVSFGATTALVVGQVNEGAAMNDARVSDIAVATHNGQTYVFASYGGEDTVGMFHREANGTLRHVSDFDAGDGLWVDRPGALAVTSGADGKLYVVVAGSGSDSLSVLSVAANGSGATVVDHLFDTRDTRFADATHVESFTVDGRDFILAAGSDSGLSLFSMLPGGRLHHEGSFEATVDAPLNGLTSLEVMVEPGGLRIWAATEAAPFLSEISLSLANIGTTQLAPLNGGTTSGGMLDDVLIGWAGADLLNGGAGDDVLMDGGGSDSLRGGLGEDTFIFARDGQTDTILDFQHTQDVIDLSGFGALGGAFNVSIVTRSWGAEFRVGTETINVYSADGLELHEGHFSDANLIVTGRAETNVSLYEPVAPTPAPVIAATPPPAPAPPPPVETGAETDETVTGTAPDALAYLMPGAYSFAAGANTLYGTNAANILFTDEKNDHVYALGGEDTINTAAGNDVIVAGGGQDLVNGGAGHDRIHGSGGLDTLWGGDGHDQMLGGDFGDQLFGQEGNDSLQGNDGFDLVEGADGNDDI